MDRCGIVAELAALDVGYPVHIRGQAFIFTVKLGPDPAAVTGRAVLLVVGRREEIVALNKSALHRDRTGDVALPAAGVALAAFLVEMVHQLTVGGDVSAEPLLDEMIVALHGLVQTAAVVRCDIAMTGAANRIFPIAGGGNHGRVGLFHLGGSRVATVTTGTADFAVLGIKKRGTNIDHLPCLNLRHRAASAFTRFSDMREGGSERFEKIGIGVAGDASIRLAQIELGRGLGTLFGAVHEKESCEEQQCPGEEGLFH